jgi:hypothetical protein
VAFTGEAQGQSVRCAISREALDDNFGATTGLTREQRLDKFRKNSSTIERLAREKYLFWPIENPEVVLIKTVDVPELQRAIAKKESTVPGIKNRKS